MASTEAFAELDRVRKALKHARIKRDRVPKGDAEARRRAEEKVAALEARRDELYEQHGRRTAKKLEDAQADHEGGAAAVRRAIAMLQTGLSRMEGAQRDTVAAASAAYPSGPTATPAPTDPARDSAMSYEHQPAWACSGTGAASASPVPVLEPPAEPPGRPGSRKRVASSASAAAWEVEQPAVKRRGAVSSPEHCYSMPPDLADHYRPGFVDGALLRALSDHAMSLYEQAEPIHLQRFPKKPLSQCLKVFMADVKPDGWFPQYQFAKMATRDYSKRSDIQGTPVADLVLMLRRSFPTDASLAHGEPVCAANCYARGAGDGIPSHRDQAFTTMSDPDCETVGTVFIVTVLEDDTGKRPLCCINCAQNQGRTLHGHSDIDSINKAGVRITGAVAMEHGSLLALPGSFNRGNYHCVLEEPQGYAARRVTYTIRFCMRLFVNSLTAEYRVWNRSSGWEKRALGRSASNS